MDEPPKQRLKKTKTKSDAPKAPPSLDPFKLSGRADGPFYAWRFERGQWRRRSTRMLARRAADAVAKRWRAEGELVASGAETSITMAARRSLVEHLDAFIDARKDRPDAPGAKHLRDTKARCLAIVDAMGWQRIDEVTADGFAAAMSILSAKASNTMAPGLSNGSKNLYRAAMKSFTRWMHRTGAAPSDPLLELAAWPIEGQERRRRRALTRAEFERLAIATESSQGEIGGMTGRDRAMLYRVAVWTGFRLGELRRLTPGHFRFEAAGGPIVTLGGDETKSGRAESQLLAQANAATLRTWMAGRGPAQRLWPTLPEEGGFASSLRKDLAAAGLKERGERGELIDFHSFRHTFGTWVSEGLDAKATQMLMRHSDINLTMKRYVHREEAYLRGVLDAIFNPTVCAAVAQQKTTPDDDAQRNEAPKAAASDPGAAPEAEAVAAVDDAGERLTTTEEGDAINASSRTRTLDPLIKSSGAVDSVSAQQQTVAQSGVESAALRLRAARAERPGRKRLTVYQAIEVVREACARQPKRGAR